MRGRFFANSSFNFHIFDLVKKERYTKKTRNKNDTEKVSAKIFKNSDVYEMYVNEMKSI